MIYIEEFLFGVYEMWKASLSLGNEIKKLLEKAHIHHQNFQLYADTIKQ
jgi:hypothetical protein